MPTQVYAVVYSSANRNFFIAIKNARGYFFHNPNGSGGTIIPAGQTLNGGGNFALPGGGLDGRQPVPGAMAEFFEETNLNLDDYNHFVRPPAYYQVYNRQWNFYGVYFDVENATLDQIEPLANTNLDQASKAVIAIRAGTYGAGDYVAMRAAFPGCPMDDELDSAHIWNLIGNWEEIARWRNDPNLGWFYSILLNLRMALGIPPAEAEAEASVAEAKQ